MTETPFVPFQLVTRHIVMERDLSPAGNLFGGVMLGWLDEASAIHVIEETGYTDFVTASMNDVRFKAPAHSGDLVSILSRVARTGKSSIDVETRAVITEPRTGAQRETIACRFTFVCLKDGRPYPYFTTEEYAARRGSPS